VGSGDAALVDSMLGWIRCTLMIVGVLTAMLVIMSYPVLAPFALMAMVWHLALKDS
jgi:hypothetical protein